MSTSRTRDAPPKGECSENALLESVAWLSLT